jgi:catechol 2,3-dioxygenase-like lactoylglutathione lyase family enzyme
MDMKLEVIVVPVSDVDNAKQFYTGLGWRLDADFTADDGLRVVQITPTGAELRVGIRNTAATRHSPHSTIPTATNGSCRRSPNACRDAES